MTQSRQIKNSEGCLSLIFKLFGLFGDEDTATSLPYRRRESILTAPEREFYLVLLQAVESRATVIPKVGLQDIFFITDKEKYQTARNRIAQRHLDFLICENNSLRPLFGIELDDSSHKEAAHQKRDAFKNLVFEAALLPLIRVPVKHKFDVITLQTLLTPQFNQADKTGEPPLCPNHKVPMVRKTARHGEFKGKDFYSCPNYPTCKELINIE